MFDLQLKYYFLFFTVRILIVIKKGVKNDCVVVGLRWLKFDCGEESIKSDCVVVGRMIRWIKITLVSLLKANK